MSAIREPAVAGQFYPADPTELARTVTELVEAAPAHDLPVPKALIVPHAGYVYSGPVAASGYAQLAPYGNRYRRVVLLGPCHRVPVSGLAVPHAEAFRTPLGEIALDRATIDRLAAQPGMKVYDVAHAMEHSLEVHLPFLQRLLDDFVLVPIVVGDASPALVARVLDRLWNGPETLVVVSSDLSHYLPYESAQAVDAETCAAITAFDHSRLDHAAACGATPVAGLLITARRRGMKVTTLDLRNSGDTAGDRAAVVGYGAWLFAP